MSQPRALTITVEGKSDEHLRKLLELALFDLDQLQQEDAWHRGEGESVSASMAGDMGHYVVDYKIGTHAAAAAHEDLVAKGYKRTETTKWGTNNYSVYEHSELPPLRLYLNTAETGEHDLENHEDNSMRF